MLTIFRMTTSMTSPWLMVLFAVVLFSPQPAVAQDRIDRVRQEREARDREADRRMDRDRPERREIDDRMDWDRRPRDPQIYPFQFERLSAQARIASDEVLSASFALEYLPELIRNRQERREVVTDMMQQTDNPAIKRLLRMKLLEYSLHSDQRDEALENLRMLIAP
ncbi:hypothetical protein DTL42_07610 [Bremerella cremea]|uniref:HEAT repeat domain-containing protein n=1 Tax=Bremerella cremea TaxID=1031537 RepID=A0A368KSR3_9BACT|nr:hypothetical protein [Bremerella cremea]RCS52695.1 hypothetical protein DTL42_07610 [Bremerella cremea]